jgi:Indigoidine synthase A like protein
MQQATVFCSRQILSLYDIGVKVKYTIQRQSCRTLFSDAQNVRIDSNIFQILPTVREALNNGQPIVALESTIIAHGMPYPSNVDLALELNQIMRDKNVEPATIGRSIILNKYLLFTNVFQAVGSLLFSIHV